MFEYEKDKQRVSQVYSYGIDLYIDGARTSPEILSQFINEDGVYMADYVWDDGGNLLEVRYDKINKVSHKKKP